MANHKSALKRHRQGLARRARNRTTRSSCRTAIKKVRAAIEGGDVTAASELLRQAQKSIATAATKGVYHKRNASRKISRLAKLVAGAQNAGTATA